MQLPRIALWNTTVLILTDRELQIITSLARGNGNKQIARALAISERIVRSHVSNIYKKLHICEQTQAVLYAIREGLVDVERPQERLQLGQTASTGRARASSRS